MKNNEEKTRRIKTFTKIEEKSKSFRFRQVVARNAESRQTLFMRVDSVSYITVYADMRKRHRKRLLSYMGTMGIIFLG